MKGSNQKILFTENLSSLVGLIYTSKLYAIKSILQKIKFDFNQLLG